MKGNMKDVSEQEKQPLYVFYKKVFLKILLSS